MEEVNQKEENPISKAWPSIVIVGLIFSLVSFALSLFFSYQQINSEPSGSFFSPAMFSGVVICLITCVAGALAVWHFTKEVSKHLTLGQGALIGFLTGAVIVLFSVILNELWQLFDPDFTEKLIEATIANVEAMDLPAESKNDMIDSMAEGVRSQQSILQQLFWGIPITGLLNLVSGMIGVKLFAEKEEESF